MYNLAESHVRTAALAAGEQLHCEGAVEDQGEAPKVVLRNHCLADFVEMMCFVFSEVPWQQVQQVVMERHSEKGGGQRKP